jgi:hypothetical protein
MRSAVLVNDGYGGIYRLSARGYARYLASLARGEDVSPARFGSALGYARNMRDTTPEEAGYALEPELLSLLDKKTREQLASIEYDENGQPVSRTSFDEANHGEEAKS